MEKKVTNEELLERVKDANKNMLGALSKAMERFGLTNIPFVNGLSMIPCSTGLPFEDNINNILVTFTHNYLDSVFFQAKSMRNDIIINMVAEFLDEKELFNEFKSKYNLSEEQKRAIEPTEWQAISQERNNNLNN